MSEIKRETGDLHSDDAFRRVVRNVPESKIHQALSSVRIAMAEINLRSAGAYSLPPSSELPTSGLEGARPHQAGRMDRLHHRAVNATTGPRGSGWRP